MSTRFRVAFVAVFLFVMSGCTTISNLFDDPTANAVAELSFGLSVDYLIDQKELDAQKIVDHMDALQDLLDGDAEATVSLLAERLLEEIDFEGMDKNKELAIRSIIPILAARAEIEIENRGQAPETTRVVVSEVIGWVRERAQLHVSMQAAE